MAKDDYFRIVYLILRYLYSQMKKVAKALGDISDIVGII